MFIRSMLVFSVVLLAVSNPLRGQTNRAASGDSLSSAVKEQEVSDRQKEAENAENLSELVRQFQQLMQSGGKEHGESSSTLEPAAECIHTASRAGDLDKVKEFVASGVEIDKVGEKGRTALYEACLGGSEEVAAFLLSRGADKNAPDLNGWQPIHAAVYAGALECLSLLKTNGVDVNVRNYYETTPLHIAAQYGQAMSAMYLLASAAEVNRFDYAGNTPLHLAAKSKHYKVVEILVDKGVETGYCNDVHLTALNLAIEKHDKKMVGLLLDKGVSPDQYNMRGFTPLIEATRARQYEMVKVLLERGASPNIPGFGGWYPLRFVRLPEGGDSNKEIAKLLREYGAVRVDDKATPLPVFMPKKYEKTFWFMGPEKFRNPGKTELEEMSLELLGQYLDDGGDVNARDAFGNTFLHWSSCHGFVKMSKFLIEAGVDVNARNVLEESALLVAAASYRAYNTEVMKLLLDAGADVDAVDNCGKGALYKLIWRYKNDPVKLLLSYGADANISTIFGATPLFELCGSSGAAGTTAMLLLEKGADVNKVDYAGRTPLHAACEKGRVQIVSYLIQYGAKVNVPDHYGVYPLHNCTTSETVAKILLEQGANVNVGNRWGFTALHTVTAQNRENMLRFLVANNADVNVQADNGVAPLHNAARTGNASMVQFLLDNGATADLKDNTGKTAVDYARENRKDNIVALLTKGSGSTAPANVTKAEKKILRDKERKARKLDNRFMGRVFGLLQRDCPAIHKAVLQEDIEAIEKEISSGADVNKLFSFGRESFAPLHLAVHMDNEKIIKLLLDNGADINLPGLANRTPLHCAAEYGLVEIAEFLIEAGADILAGDSSGRTPLREAVVAKEPEIVKLLASKGVDINRREGNMKETDLHAALRGDGLYALLIEMGADVNAKDSIGRTPLHRAAVAIPEDVRVGRYLLEHGAQLEATNNDKETALHVACYKGKVHFVELLLEYGADINARDERGAVALHRGAGTPEIIKMLLEKGADVKSETDGGRTPLNYLAGSRLSQQGPECIDLLLEAGADINNQGQFGTPLHEAARHNRIEIVRILLENGAGLSSVDNVGKSILHSCVASPEVTRLVVEKGITTVLNEDDGRNPIHVYASAYPYHKRDAETLDLLIAAGSDINGVDNQGNSPLHLATLQGRIDIVEQLLERQVVIDIANKKGETPLSWAREKDNAEMISCLLAHGATR